MYTVELTKRNKWFYRIKNRANGQTLVVSQDYFSKFNAKRAALKMAKTNNFEYREV